MNMRDVVPKDSRYVPLTQQKSCCVPTCIQMVMLRNGIPLLPAEELGYHLGLTIHPSRANLFYNARVSEVRPPAGYGTQIYKPEYSPNKAFKKLNIPLKMSWSLIDKFATIESFKEYLSRVESSGKDVLVCYDWPTLFDQDETDHWGHVCVLDKMFIEKGEVRMIDPSPDWPKWNMVKIEKLYEAMKFHGASKSGGFWELVVN